MVSHLTFKILVIGDQDVGKTTLINHYTLMPACFNSGSTIGIDFQSRMVALSADLDPDAIIHAVDAVDDPPFKLGNGSEGTQGTAFRSMSPKSVKNYDHVKCCFWDTSGSPHYQGIAHSYYKHISAIIVVFDLSNEKTYASLSSYIHRAIRKNSCNHQHKHPILVIGNKLDKRTIQKTCTQIHHDLCLEFPYETIKYAEVSCLDKVYVDDAIFNNNRIDNINNVGSNVGSSKFAQTDKTSKTPVKTAAAKTAAAKTAAPQTVYNCATCAKSSDVHFAITSFLQLAYDSAIKPHYYNPNAIADIGCAGINGTSRYFKLKRDKDSSSSSSSSSSIKTPRKCCGEHYYSYSTHLYPSSPSPSEAEAKEKDYSGCGCTIL
jgi:small GTP-binding protein